VSHFESPIAVGNMVRIFATLWRRGLICKVTQIQGSATISGVPLGMASMESHDGTTSEVEQKREKQRLRMREYRMAKRDAKGLPPAKNSHLLVKYGSRPKKGDPGWNEYNAERMRKSRERKRAESKVPLDHPQGDTGDGSSVPTSVPTSVPNGPHGT
jgi:hypothetical protein